MPDETTAYGSMLCLAPIAALGLGWVFAWMVSGAEPLPLRKRAVCGAFIGFFVGVVGSAVPIDVFMLPRQVGWFLPVIACSVCFPPLALVVIKYGIEWNNKE